jgi:mRNA interferase RelE/StbE
MASYHVEWTRAARKNMRRLPAREIAKISMAVNSLGEDPYPPGSLKLSGSEDAFRIRVGDYRVIYAVAEELVIVRIARVGHRKDIYRK